MKKRVLVVAGGYIDDVFAGDYINNRKYEIRIACDRGMEFYKRAGLQPDLILGDFDSADPKVLQYFQAMEEISCRQFPPEKDWTDTELAVMHAIKLGATHIDLFGATGSRLDHVLGNLSILGLGLQAGVEICMIDAHNRIRLIDREHRIKKDEQFGSFVSLIPYMGAVAGVTLRGFQYPLEHAAMDGFHSLGISNEIVEDEAMITLEQGLLLVIESKD